MTDRFVTIDTRDHGPQDDACPICGYWTCRCPRSSRRLAAVGVIRRTGGRTLRITATQTGITGSITGVAR